MRAQHANAGCGADPDSLRLDQRQRVVDRGTTRFHMQEMVFASRISRAPIPYDPAAGAVAAARHAAHPVAVREVIAGAAGCSPFLGGLLATEAGWLDAALAVSPETALQTVLTPLPDVPPDQLAAALRQAKRRVALLAGLADLGGVWPLANITAALTRLADVAVHLALTTLAAEEVRRGRIPGASADDAATACGMVALAMGKMGADELNYSSDIDLICLFDDSRFATADLPAARAAFVRITRRMTGLLSDLTAAGYVFRTDLRLRPDAAVTPVCLSMAAAERYYEAEGRTWERAAYIKARPCGGDLAAGQRFLRTLVPFVWRRHLDFAAIEDAHDMRLRIRSHRGRHGPLVLEGHNIKLGTGGIREIEFFTQTRQIIAGGRDPSLRARGTVAALGALARAGWVPHPVTEAMAADYAAHREVEHRLQMIRDAQTHDLPATAEGFDRLARFMGIGDTDGLRRDLRARLERVQQQTEDFFDPAAGRVAAGGATERMTGGIVGRDDACGHQTEWSDAARCIVERWRSYPALRSPRAAEIFGRVRPQVLAGLARAADPEAALAQFDAFLAALPAGVQLFSLFDANPHLIELMVDISATAPNLARYLGRNAGVLDAVLGGSFFSSWPGLAGLTDALAAHLAGEPDYERQLDAARRWSKEWHFRIGVHHLRGLVDAFEAGEQYADLAGAVVAALWPPCAAEFARKHGVAPGRGAGVLAMGSLGAGRLNAGSDLDLIVIYDAAGVAASDGPRPLAARAYYARLTQALVTALTAPTAAGRLYDVDMRLRPSGRQGPVATSLQAFCAYQQTEAWTWEHLALTRARCVAGSPDLMADVEAFRRALLAVGTGGVVAAHAGVPPAPRDMLADVAQMRARIEAAKPVAGAWEAKTGAGRLQDIELLAQTAALRAGDPARAVAVQLRAGVRAGWLGAVAEIELLEAWRLCWQVQAVARLLGGGDLDPGAIGIAGRAFLLRETGAPDADTLAARLAQVTSAAAGHIEAALAAPGAAGLARRGGAVTTAATRQGAADATGTARPPDRHR